MNLWQELVHTFTETVYPKVCPGCGMRGSWVCDLCAATVPFLNVDICERCGGPAFGIVCRDCVNLASTINMARSLFPYTGWVAMALHRLKYRDEWGRSEQFGPQLAELVAAFGDIDGLVPVPLHRKRLEDRGYNQSAELAEAAARHCDIRVVEALARTKRTRPQVELGRAERLANMANAFALDCSPFLVRDKRLVLIDDVRTTGATVSACADVLVDAGAAEVYVVTIAHDVHTARLDHWMRLREEAINE